MNILVLLFVALIALYLGYRFYAGFLSKVLGIDPSAKTPAVEFNDGKDYCPTKNQIVFAHHFSSIAGAGPILGPTMAIIFGVLPVWMWLIIGGIFIGAVHDYVSLFVSIREKGKSIAEIARTSLGKPGFTLVIIFTILMIVLVTSAFLVASATSLTSMISLETLRLPSDQNILRTAVVNGILMGKIGGIASTSVIIITLFAPLIGYLNYKKNVSVAIVTTVAIIICLIAVITGVYLPVNLDRTVWMIVLSIYTLFAAGVPVWMLLQPRDFVNAYILYGGILLLVMGAIGAGLSGTTIDAPLFNVQAGTLKLGLIWPVLFITVACGAISGFHALVTGGTVSKQVTSEKSAKTIGYGGMLLESLLAVGVVIALCSGIRFDDLTAIIYPEKGISNPILAFALAMSGLVHKGLHIPMVYGTIFGILLVEGFVATTLDTAVRINRYLFEELWSILFVKTPGWMKSYLFNSLLSVGLMLILAFTNAFSAIWPIFGTANQLLAALTLITLAAWLSMKGKKNFFVVIPAFFMIITTIFSLVLLAQKYLRNSNYVLFTTDILMMVLSVALVVVAVRRWMKGRDDGGNAGGPEAGRNDGRTARLPDSRREEECGVRG
jgi:carbon starvation protein